MQPSDMPPLQQPSVKQKSTRLILAAHIPDQWWGYQVSEGRLQDKNEKLYKCKYLTIIGELRMELQSWNLQNEPPNRAEFYKIS
ncbi:hypothetical protein RP20_CCG007021 [Aedes albopictus]|nr:hypothetical protein RP20_CCG007021 [Aedes albopictus]